MNFFEYCRNFFMSLLAIPVLVFLAVFFPLYCAIAGVDMGEFKL